jgi:hypothetical protein
MKNETNELTIQIVDVEISKNKKLSFSLSFGF